jgi:hypothetical protein
MGVVLGPDRGNVETARPVQVDFATGLAREDIAEHPVGIKDIQRPDQGFGLFLVLGVVFDQHGQAHFLGPVFDRVFHIFDQRLPRRILCLAPTGRFPDPDRQQQRVIGHGQSFLIPRQPEQRLHGRYTTAVDLRHQLGDQISSSLCGLGTGRVSLGRSGFFQVGCPQFDQSRPQWASIQRIDCILVRTHLDDFPTDLFGQPGIIRFGIGQRP